MPPNQRKKVFIDFDGVIHSFNSGWTNADDVSARPVVDPTSGLDAIAWLSSLLASDELELHIYSRRGHDPALGGIAAMQSWLLEHGMAPDDIDRIHWATGKPDWFVIIDDRAIGFDGTFPAPHELNGFRPWNQKKE